MKKKIILCLYKRNFKRKKRRGLGNVKLEESKKPTNKRRRKKTQEVGWWGGDKKSKGEKW